MSGLADRFFLLLIALAACSPRGMHTNVPGPHAELAEAKGKQLISIWQEQVHHYIDRQGDGDPAVLSQTRALHSRDVLRPGRITFGALDTFAGSDPVRFPGDTDRFSMSISGDRVRVDETQSGADWSLRLSTAPPPNPSRAFPVTPGSHFPLRRSGEYLRPRR